MAAGLVGGGDEVCRSCTDFKPNNVLITFDYQHGPDAHIIDFGISVTSGARPLLAWHKYISSVAAWTRTVVEGRLVQEAVVSPPLS